MAKICYILRGLPGSGKSMLAESLKDGAFPKGFGAIFSTDDLFMVDGEYQFDPSKLKEYHMKNLQNAGAWMKEHSSVTTNAYCIIDNTNTQHWEFAEYKKMAKHFGFMVQVITVDWDSKDIPLYAKRNSHGVPEEAIRRMAIRWE
jgi:predicted kinase